MQGLGVKHCALSWSRTLFFVMECNTVHGDGMQHCAWSFSTILCMVMECNNVHGLGLHSMTIHSVVLHEHAQCGIP